MCVASVRPARPPIECESTTLERFLLQSVKCVISHQIPVYRASSTLSTRAGFAGTVDPDPVSQRCKHSAIQGLHVVAIVEIAIEAFVERRVDPHELAESNVLVLAVTAYDCAAGMMIENELQRSIVGVAAIL